VPPKKRNSGKPKTHRQGVSGNPQRRAQQLRERRAQGQPAFGQLPLEPPADPDRAAFRELAYRLAGGCPDEAWWRESHERILARARALTWPSRLVDLETQACQIVGDEFYDRLQSPGPAKRPAPRLQCSSTTRMTSRPPRMTRRRSAATSEPHRAGFCAMTTRRSRSAPDRWPRGTCTLVRPPTCSRPPTTRNGRTVSSCTSSRLSCSVGSSVRIKAWRQSG
jgi:hypothetical protein